MMKLLSIKLIKSLIANKPLAFIVSFTVILLLIGGITLHLSFFIMNELFIPILIYSISFFIFGFLFLIIIATKLWTCIFVQKESKISHLNKNVNLIFILAGVLVISILLDFIGGSLIIWKINVIKVNHTLIILPLVSGTSLLIFIKIWFIRVSYRNFRINFIRSK